MREKRERRERERSGERERIEKEMDMGKKRRVFVVDLTWVRALNSLQNPIRLRPAWPMAGPTGGAGLAAPARDKRNNKAERGGGGGLDGGGGGGISKLS